MLPIFDIVFILGTALTPDIKLNALSEIAIEEGKKVYAVEFQEQTMGFDRSKKCLYSGHMIPYSVDWEERDADSGVVRFPRYLVCHQVSFMQRVFPDFAYSSSDRDIELAIDIRVLNAGGFDYKRLRYIRSWQPSFQHG